MKVYELLKFSRELLLKIHTAGVKVDDYKYVDMFMEYQALKDKGDKITYIVNHLSTKYEISERQVYCVISRMQRDVLTA